MGRLYRRHRDGNWYGDFTTPEGRRVQQSLGTKDKAVAKERLRQAELAATPTARGRKQRLSEAIDHVIGVMVDRAAGTREMYEQKGRRIIESFGDPFVHEITRDKLAGYIKLRLSDDPDHGGANPHTVQKELITFRRALREAHERGVLTTMPPMPRFSAKYKPREVWLTADEFELVIASIGRAGANDEKATTRRSRRRARRPTREHVPVANRVLWASIAALAGASASEVEKLDWADISLARGWLKLRGEKRETRARRVPIAPALAVRLREAGPKAHGPVVAPWDNVRRALHQACAKAGLWDPKARTGKRVSPNDLRRTFASWLVQQGVPLLTVATLMGHSSTRMVEKVYGRLAPENLEAAIAVLPTFQKALAECVSDSPGVTDGVTESVLVAATPGHSGDKERCDD